MKKVFVSHSFGDRDRSLVTHVDALLRSHGLVAVTGKNLGGGGLTPEIAKRIEDCDAMIGLLTQRDGEPAGTTHPWVLQEFAHARFKNMRAVGVYETGIPVAAADVGNERVEFSAADPLVGFVRLSEIIGEWRRAAGRFLKAIAMPSDLAQSLGAQADNVRCEVRFLIGGRETEWEKVRVIREVGSVVVVLRVPDDVDAMQLRTVAPLASVTPYTPLWPTLHFDRN